MLLIHRHHTSLLLQIISLVLGGGRLEIPARERLPGPDTRSFAGGAGCVCARFAAAVCTHPSHMQLLPLPHTASLYELLPPAGLEAYTQLVRRCWAQNQLDRPAFQDIVRELRWAGRQAGPAGVAELPPFQWMHALCRLCNLPLAPMCVPWRCRDLREGMDGPQAAQPTSRDRTGGSAGQAGHSAAFGAGIYSQAKA